MARIEEKNIKLAIVHGSGAVLRENTTPQEEIGRLNLFNTGGTGILSEKEYLELENNCKDFEGELRERRRGFRIEVQLTGSYIANGSGERGLIALRDVSYSGLRYELNSARAFYKDAKKIIAFSLDTYPLTVIRREIIIKNVRGKFIGAEFVNQYEHDALPHYLRFKKKK
jgi:hypothetical protein